MSHHTLAGTQTNKLQSIQAREAAANITHLNVSESEARFLSVKRPNTWDVLFPVHVVRVRVLLAASVTTSVLYS